MAAHGLALSSASLDPPEPRVRFITAHAAALDVVFNVFTAGPLGTPRPNQQVHPSVVDYVVASSDIKAVKGLSFALRCAWDAHEPHPLHSHRPRLLNRVAQCPLSSASHLQGVAQRLSDIT
jgi:hypothetical protein